MFLPGRSIPLLLSSAFLTAVIFCPLLSAVLPCPKCLPVGPNLPLLASSFLCSLDTNSHVIQLLAENRHGMVYYLGSFDCREVGTRQNCSEIYPSTLVWEIQQTHLQLL